MNKSYVGNQQNFPQLPNLNRKMYWNEGFRIKFYVSKANFPLINLVRPDWLGPVRIASFKSCGGKMADIRARAFVCGTLKTRF